MSAGRDAWLERQLHPERIRDTLGRSLEQKYPLIGMSMTETMVRYLPPPRPKQMAGDTAMMAAEKRVKDPKSSPQSMLIDLASARLERAAGTERQLEEVMTDFWFNHFNVFFQKGADRYLVADYERTAIRPNVFNHFEDLLKATARHPAMLFYLDNWQSVHVDSSLLAVAASRRRQQPQQPPRRAGRGLNENYARELLELHTLGVDGGYTQKDVVEVARAMTGWTFTQAAAKQGGQARGRDGDEVAFLFRDQMHDRNEKVVLGHRLRAGRGIQDGEDVLHILATHPQTARFISTKLVEYFVSDRPSPELVDRLAAVFMRTNGDLREVTRALFSDPSFYANENQRSKFKTPFQLLASTLRATDAQIPNSRRMLQTLRTMGHMPYLASAPTGYPAMSDDWVNSGAMLARMNFGLEYASGSLTGGQPLRSIARTAATAREPGEVIRSATAVLLPGVNTTQLQRAILEDANATAGDAKQAPRAQYARLIGLVLGSPEFQRH
ncbi:MAG: DUF1800 domain-containing protein [Longimicrobiales bacterium]